MKRILILFFIMTITTLVQICPARSRKSDKAVIHRSSISRSAEVLAGSIALHFRSNELQLHKNNLAVFPFTAGSKTVSNKGIDRTFMEIMSVALKKTGEFDLIDRENVDRILGEMELGLSGLTDTDQANEVGKLMAANLYLSGRVGEVGNTYLITVRMTRIETGEIVFTDKVEFPKNEMNNLAVLHLLTPKYPVVAAFRSALIPGWGQFYNETPGKGVAFLSLGLASALNAAAFGISLKINQNLGDKKRVEYDSWAGWPEKDYQENIARAEELYNDMKTYYDRAETFAKVVNISLISYGAVWLFAVMDGLFTARGRLKKLEKARQQLSRADQRPFSGLAMLPLIRRDQVGVTLALEF